MTASDGAIGLPLQSRGSHIARAGPASRLAHRRSSVTAASETELKALAGREIREATRLEHRFVSGLVPRRPTNPKKLADTFNRIGGSPKTQPPSDRIQTRD